MALSRETHARLAGMWGSYDFRLIRDKHFVTTSDMVEHFLEYYIPQWSRSRFSTDLELAENTVEVRALVERWAAEKHQRILTDESSATIQTHIMCKRLNYGHRQSISFGSIGTNWKKKTDIAAELARYRPWSIDHVLAQVGEDKDIYQHMMAIVTRTSSPTERTLFDAWWRLSGASGNFSLE